jgi:hypothetical protein
MLQRGLICAAYGALGAGVAGVNLCQGNDGQNK